MFPELVAERQPSTRVVVDDQVAAAELWAALGQAGIEVDRVTEVRAGQPPVVPSDAPDGSAAASSS
jgi:hypothetical protein